MPSPAGAMLADDVERSILDSLSRAEHRLTPFPNWRLSNLFPEGVARALERLPICGADTAGVSGKRELHNESRHYFAGNVLGDHPLARRIAEAFQGPRVVQAISLLTGALLIGTYLRIEYAVDLDGFWLEPHTDLGVKAFTLLFQLGRPGQEDLGTDLYAGPGAWSERVPFNWNSGLIFVPSDNTWHGFEPRPIRDLRRSLIVNYVTEGWRAREQLAFQESPVRD